VNAAAAAYPNVTVVRASLNALAVSQKLDIIWTSQNYHDLKNGGVADTAAVNKAAFAALKPGGYISCSIMPQSQVRACAIPAPCTASTRRP